MAKTLVSESPDILPKLGNILEKLYKVFDYGVIQLLETIYFQSGDKSYEFEATDYPGGRVYSVDAKIPSGAEVVDA